MKTFYSKIIFISIVLLCRMNSWASASPVEINIIPKPVSMILSEGGLDIEDGFKIESEDPKLLNLSNYLISALNELNFKAETSTKSLNKQTTIFLYFNTEITNPEGYQLKIEDKGISIAGASEQGIFYGIQSLLSVISQQKNKIFTLPHVVINDYPRFKYRGMHLDVSRHFFPLSFVKKYIDILAMHKMNRLHWHLTDDQGWRIEIKKYPQLTSIGAWRKGNGMEDWNYYIQPAVEGQPKYGGFYTQEQIKEIIAYAQSRFITIIPEIEMPAHSWTAINIFPELSCTGKAYKKPDSIAFANTSPYCAGNEKTFEFIENVLDEVINLFPSEYIHIGGDEASKRDWAKCEKCKKRMVDEKLQNVAELQSYFIKRIEKYVTSKGRKIIGWDEILEGGLAPNATVMSWRGEEGGIAAAKSGHDAIMTPGKPLYFDNYQDDPSFEPTAIGGYSNLKDVYDYNPVPKELSEAEKLHIIGAQGNMWTEFIKTSDQVEYMLLPRLAALSEIVWTPDELKNWEDFTKRLSHFCVEYDFHHYNYQVSQPLGFEKDNDFLTDTLVQLSSPLYNTKIYYTTNNAEPTNESKQYVSPIKITETQTLKAICLLPGGKKSAVRVGKFAKATLKDGIKDTSHLEKGISYKYYEGKINSFDSIKRLPVLRQGQLEEIQIPSFTTRANWTMVFDGYISVPANGVYEFYTFGDSYNRLYINNELIIDNKAYLGDRLDKGSIALKAGFHPIRVEYIRTGWGETFDIGLINNNKMNPLKASNLYFKK